MTNKSISFEMDETEVDRVRRAIKEKTEWMVKAGLEMDSRWYQHLVDTFEGAHSATISIKYK